MVMTIVLTAVFQENYASFASSLPVYDLMTELNTCLGGINASTQRRV